MSQGPNSPDNPPPFDITQLEYEFEHYSGINHLRDIAFDVIRHQGSRLAVMQLGDESVPVLGVMRQPGSFDKNAIPLDVRERLWGTVDPAREEQSSYACSLETPRNSGIVLMRFSRQWHEEGLHHIPGMYIDSVGYLLQPNGHRTHQRFFLDTKFPEPLPVGLGRAIYEKIEDAEVLDMGFVLGSLWPAS